MTLAWGVSEIQFPISGLSCLAVLQQKWRLLTHCSRFPFVQLCSSYGQDVDPGIVLKGSTPGCTALLDVLADNLKVRGAFTGQIEMIKVVLNFSLD